jgi:hypothetical protein
VKKTHIIILVLIAAVVSLLISFMGNVSTYESIASAKQKDGKTVTIIAKLDRSLPIEFDAKRNPNYTTFHIMDTLGNKAKVEYYFEKPFDMEKAERLVMSGKMNGDIFEIRKKDGILIKCPSKYKDDPKAASNNLKQTSY